MCPVSSTVLYTEVWMPCDPICACLTVRCGISNKGQTHYKYGGDIRGAPESGGGGSPGVLQGILRGTIFETPLDPSPVVKYTKSLAMCPTQTQCGQSAYITPLA